jgi:hypothetical protein
VTILIDLHHLIIDGASIRPFLARLSKVIDGEQVEPDLMFLKSSAFDRSMEKNPRYMESKELMLNEIIGADTDYFSSDHSSEAIGLMEKCLTVPLIEVEDYIRKNHYTHNGLFATILGRTLTEISGKDRCLFYVTEDGRGHLGLDDSACLYAKPVPLSIKFEGADMEDTISDVTGRLMKMIDHDEYPMWKLMQEYSLPWDIRFQYVHYSDYVKSSVVKFSPLSSNNVSLFCDIWSRVSPKDGCFVLDIMRSRRFSDEMINRMGEVFDDILTKVVRGGE